jgi:hypothetical protein
MTQQKTQTPTQQIKDWIEDFVTKPNPVFGDLPPCPFARKAMLENKVKFLELDSVADYPTVYQHIIEADFDEIDVLVQIARPDHFTLKQTKKIAEDLNSYFMERDVVILEDHPEDPEHVGTVKLNNGKYILILSQRLSKLNKFAKLLEVGPYYKNWSKDYLESVKGFRERKSPKV